MIDLYVSLTHDNSISVSRLRPFREWFNSYFDHAQDFVYVETLRNLPPCKDHVASAFILPFQRQEVTDFYIKHLARLAKSDTVKMWLVRQRLE